MDKIWNTRLVTVIIVTALTLFFVYPTFRYFAFMSSLPDKPSEAQLAQKKELLKRSDMMKLGLDLQGGVDFLFAIDSATLKQQNLASLVDSLRAELTSERVKAEVTLNKDQTVTVKVPDAADVKLARKILEARKSDFDMSSLDALDGGYVTLNLREEDAAAATGGAVDAALDTIKRRVDEYGLTQPEVFKQGIDRIRVRIPGETDPDRIREGLLKTAFLEFRLLHPDHDTIEASFGAQTVFGSGKDKRPYSIVKPEFIDEIPIPGTEKKTKKLKNNGYLPGLPAGYRAYLGEDSFTEASGKRISVKDIIYILKDKAEVTGANLRRAGAEFNPSSIDSPYSVSLEFDRQGTEKFAEVTKDNEGRRFAIVLDNMVMSAPRINEPILYGRCQITGDFKPEDARDLSLVLKAGSLKAPLMIVESNELGASLGVDSIVDSAKALVIGAVALVILIVFVYRAAGLIAVFAMFLNILMIIAFLSLAGATLTLSGIGGILLTMGMAVDANVLIYERLREELAAGKPIRAAINASFNRAFTVIIDAHVTTLLPALALIMFEIVQGSVKGFWVSLTVGMAVNLYTGLNVTRALMEAWVYKFKKIDLGGFNPFKSTNIDFMKYSKACYIVTVILMVISCFFIFTKINFGIDFTGGVMANVKATSAEVTRGGLEVALKKEFEEAKVVKVINSDAFQVTVPKHAGEDPGEIRKKVETAFAPFGTKVSIESFQAVDATIGEEFRWTAFWTIVVTSIIILLYIAVRFRPVYGAGAVLATLHDIFVTLGVFVILGRSVTMDIISALLIILGYSVNDTIVVFDRIRETVGDSYGKNMRFIINDAINKTLSRTLFTGGTTMVTVTSMLFFGGVGLKDFALVLLFGMIFGTYSSVFVASALVNTWMTHREKKEGLSATHGKTKTVKIAG